MRFSLLVPTFLLLGLTGSVAASSEPEGPSTAADATSAALRLEAENLRYARELARRTKKNEVKDSALWEEARKREEKLTAELCEFLTGEALTTEIGVLEATWKSRTSLSDDMDNVARLITGLEAADQIDRALKVIELVRDKVTRTEKLRLDVWKARLESYDKEVFDAAGAGVVKPEGWTLDSEKGKPLLVVFIPAFDAPLAQPWERALAQVRKTYDTSQLSIVVILVGDRAAQAAKRYNPSDKFEPAAMLTDTGAQGGVIERYGISRLPSAFLLDEKGNLSRGVSRVRLDLVMEELFKPVPPEGAR